MQAYKLSHPRPLSDHMIYDSHDGVKDRTISIVRSTITSATYNSSLNVLYIDCHWYLSSRDYYEPLPVAMNSIREARSFLSNISRVPVKEFANG